MRTRTWLLAQCFKSTQNLKNQSNTDLITFFGDEMNNTQAFMYAELQDYMTLRAQTFSTVANQQYYYNPPDIMNIDTINILIGAFKHTLTPIDSQRKWDRKNSLIFQGTAIPENFFQRRDDFGIWPIPQGVYTGTINYTYRLRNLTQTDYTTGTADVVNGSQTVTGHGTTWLASMAGQWFQYTSDQNYYRILSATATTLTLENYFQGTTSSGGTYTIGECPEVPPELHELIPYRVASIYYAAFRKDNDQATFWSNMFWTGDPTDTSRDMENAKGGFLGAQKRYSKRHNSRVIRHSDSYEVGNAMESRRWATVLS